MMQKCLFERRNGVNQTNDLNDKNLLTKGMKQCIFTTVNKRPFVNQIGAAAPSKLFWIVFLGLSIYIGYLFVPPYGRYYIFKTHVEDEAKLGHAYDNAALAKRIYAIAMDWGIPIELTDIVIVRSNKEINITIYYASTVDAAGLYRRELEYFIDTTKPVMDSSGILH